jgi:hypothetical protein|tara:strand:- start:799 stop:1092 length:294 start_codon:yes stop_codon:yes gene_type:complete
MANYIKIKAADVNVANQTSDVLIGGIVSVAQGLVNGGGSVDKFTIMTESGNSYLLTTTAKGKEWANQVISAVTANPGGVMSIVQNSTGVKVTAMVVA